MVRRLLAKIIQRIDEIAFQTNLLALNAAVEAAPQAQRSAELVEELESLVGAAHGAQAAPRTPAAGDAGRGRSPVDRSALERAA